MNHRGSHHVKKSDIYGIFSPGLIKKGNGKTQFKNADDIHRPYGQFHLEKADTVSGEAISLSIPTPKNPTLKINMEMLRMVSLISSVNG
ncbi:MAG: hypothetical protein IPN29_16760 [Saprospiraceae bacterium]|nr:hypothetical protein [Saprospiraceae bacterium]